MVGLFLPPPTTNLAPYPYPMYFKFSNLYSVLREETADFKASHKFASSSEVLENALERRKIFIQNLFAHVENEID